MAYLYLSDGGPEAEDYDSNYYRLDEITTVGETELNSLLSNIICQPSLIRIKTDPKQNNGLKLIAGIVGLVMYLLFQSLIIYIAF